MPDMTLQELSEKMQRAFEALKKSSADELKEVKEYGAAFGQTKEKIDKIQNDLDRFEKEFQKRLDEIDARTKRPEPTGKAEPKEELERKALQLYLRKGIEALGPDDRKVLRATDDTTGGFLAPSQFLAEIIKGVQEFSPVRAFARVIPTSNREIKIPVRTGVFAATWVAEAGTRTETTGLTYGLEVIPNHELYALSDISNELLEDAAFNMEEQLALEFSEQFGVAEGTAFISGSGSGQPEGIINGAGLKNVNTTGTGAPKKIASDDVVDAFFAVAESYQRNGSWLLHRGTIQAIRKLKESTTNAYIWQSGLADGTPSTIMSRPYREAKDLVSDGVAGAVGDVIGLFGDFRRGYVISDRVAISILRDNLTQAASGNVRFYARKRLGGQVVLGEALCTIKKG